MVDDDRPDPQCDAMTARLLRREALRRAADGDEHDVGSGAGKRAGADFRRGDRRGRGQKNPDGEAGEGLTPGQSGERSKARALPWTRQGALPPEPPAKAAPLQSIRWRGWTGGGTCTVSWSLPDRRSWVRQRPRHGAGAPSRPASPVKGSKGSALGGDPRGRAPGLALLHPIALDQATSSVKTLKLASVLGPNVLLIGTSTASRPRAIRMRPIRGMLLRGSKVCQAPPR